MTKLEAYQKAINAIDDYFEYQYESKKDQVQVDYILDTLRLNLKKLDSG